MSCVRRPRSNTPLQALTTLNEPLFFEAAEALAKKTLAEGGASDASRLQFAFRRVLSRAPSQTEKDTMLTLLARQTQKKDAQSAWVTVSRVLLNLDEAITKE